MSTVAIPQAFIWRRLHSLMGLWLVLFLCEHLLTNSQAAFWLGEKGQGFVRMVNSLHNLPYLEVIELTLLGVPILLHGFFGVKYLMTGRLNHQKTDGSSPSLALSRNRAYSWQRITSWILLFCLIGHVVKFRFLDYPEKLEMGNQTFYLSPLTPDPQLQTLAERFDLKLYDPQLKTDVSSFDWKEALIKQPIQSDQLLAVAPDFGTMELFIVRDTFKSPIYLGVYTLFVLAACFHAANGFWTFLITWGLVLKMAAQRLWVSISFVLMGILIFLGMAAIWGTA